MVAGLTARRAQKAGSPKHLLGAGDQYDRCNPLLNSRKSSTCTAPALKHNSHKVQLPEFVFPLDLSVHFPISPIAKNPVPINASVPGSGVTTNVFP
jgi:hypothetical protein